ncbi:hypothetical protein C0J52_28217 [Blattella germanica]|nr:hypothetical protein C0J52_28217 [Blattella germanica]
MPRTRLSLIQRKQIAAWFGIGKTVAQIQRQFGVLCQVPNRKTMLSIGEKVQETGSVKGRKVHIVNPKNINLNSRSAIKHISYFFMAYRKKNSKFPGISDTNSSGSSFEQLQETL